MQAHESTRKATARRRAQDAARRKQAAKRILELAIGKTLGGATVRELIDEGRRY